MAVVAGFVANAEGRAALSSAMHEAHMRDTRLIVAVHAVRGERGTLDAAVEEVATITEGSGLSVEVRPSESEDLAEEVLSLINEVDPDLIVIGLRRRSVTGKLILGSNAQRILLDSPTPVLAVKSNS